MSKPLGLDVGMVVCRAWHAKTMQVTPSVPLVHEIILQTEYAMTSLGRALCCKGMSRDGVTNLCRPWSLPLIRLVS